MNPPIFLDLFCGGGTWGKVAGTFGYEVISVDNRRRSGTCEPTLKLDLLNVPSSFFFSLNPHVICAGLPCDIWSNASGGIHLSKDYEPKTEKGQAHLFLLYKLLSIISANPNAYYIIENPRGKLSKFETLINYLDLTGGKIHYCTLSSYGYPTTKPTMIATNIPDLKLLPMDAFGRGAKCKVPGTFSNLTKVQRQSTPEKLIRSIIKQIPKP